MSNMNRRAFLGAAAGAAAASCVSTGKEAVVERPNILLITADDMNYDALGVTGCTTPGMTPNIDKLASEGIRFEHAHVTIAVCQPSRSVLMTGRYPHRNGAMGFEPIDTSTPTLQESLYAAGYLNGIISKVEHLTPPQKFCWDTVVQRDEVEFGRNPQLYYEHSSAFFENAKTEGKPFFLMANSDDPHRPFAGSADEERLKKYIKARKLEVTLPGASHYYKPEDIEVPGFLPDIPDVRKEVAEYYTSVHRCDETVGQILRALDESGMADNTLVMFLSDNGMAFPFAKTNCYLTSTKTPWICRWPGKTRPGVVDQKHFISGIDFMATVLEAAGIEQVAGMDGTSFLPLLKGKNEDGRDEVYTCFNTTAGRNDYFMRCVQDERYGYIYNAWADGETIFRNESQIGLTMKAMVAAAETDEEIAARVKLFHYRVPEEFYDFKNDPDALVNLAGEPEYADMIGAYRGRLLAKMVETDDPITSVFLRFVEGKE